MTDTPPNIEAFNSIVLSVFAQTYEIFPRAMRFSGREMREKLFPGDTTERTQTEENCIQAVRWLIDEGFLRCGPFGQNNEGKYIPDTRLTSKGFAILGMPSSVSTNEKPQSVYQRIKDASISGAGTTLGKKAGDVMSDVLSGMTRWAFHAVLNGGMPVL